VRRRGSVSAEQPGEFCLGSWDWLTLARIARRTIPLSPRQQCTSFPHPAGHLFTSLTARSKSHPSWVVLIRQIFRPRFPAVWTYDDWPESPAQQTQQLHRCCSTSLLLNRPLTSLRTSTPCCWGTSLIVCRPPIAPSSANIRHFMSNRTPSP